MSDTSSTTIIITIPDDGRRKQVLFQTAMDFWLATLENAKFLNDEKIIPGFCGLEPSFVVDAYISTTTIHQLIARLDIGAQH